MAFGVSASSETGYKKASVDTFSYGGGPSSGGSAFKSGLSSQFGHFAANFPRLDETSMTTRVAAVLDPNASATTPLMSRLTGDNFQATVHQDTFSPSAAVSAGGGVAASRSVDASMSSVTAEKGKLTAAVKDARKDVSDAIYAVAGNERGAMALNTLGAFDAEASKGSAVTLGITNSLMGGAAFNLLAIIAEVRSEGKKLSLDEVKAIVAEARDKLILDQRGPTESKFEQVIAAVTPAPKKFDWEKARVDELMALASATPEQQPEFKILDAQEKTLDDRRAGFKYAEENPHVSLTAVQDAGGDAMSIVQHQAQLTAQQQAPKPDAIDAGAASLAGDNLAGFIRMPIQYTPPVLPTVEEQKVAVNDMTYALAPKVSNSMAFRL